MHVAAKRKTLHDESEREIAGLSRFVPDEFAKLGDPQTAIPRIAKDAQSIQLIERAVHQVPTTHSIRLGDSRVMSGLEPQSVHLVLTSPPYWTLKEYRDSEGQLGHIEDYDKFLQELDKVWNSLSKP
jgi:modification methylase